MVTTIHESETVLEEVADVHRVVVYICDGKVTAAPKSGTVGTLKRDTGAVEVRRCDITARKLWQ